MSSAGGYIKDRVYAAMSRTDYSLEQLKIRNHPYSKTRRPSIETSAIPPLRDYMIHTRSGRLRKSLTLRINRIHRGLNKGFAAQIYFLNPPEYAGGVFFGTKVTHGRDPLNSIVALPYTRRRVSELLRSGLEKAIK